MAKHKTSAESNDEMSEEERINVLEVLREDHRKVEQLFTSYEEADGRSRQRFADEALQALEIHSAIEEKLVYPAIRKATDDQDMVAEANEEHHVVKFLIKELRRMNASAEGYKAKFTVLSELVKHHVEEEEGEMFPKAEQAKVDWDKLGQEAMKIKERMMKSSLSHRRVA
jgi:hemerythrin superfamily protein